MNIATPTKYLCGNKNRTLLGLALLIMILSAPASAAVKLVLTQAAWKSATATLTVGGRLAGSQPGTTIELYDSAGRILQSTQTDTRLKFRFSLTPTQTDGLCSVLVKAGSVRVTKALSRPPNPACAAAPQCKIVTPQGALSVNANEDVNFAAWVSAKGKKAANSLKMEWNFGGGAMGEDVTGSSLITTYRRPETATAKVRFVRDNSRYRVHFSAWIASVAGIEGFPQRCEDSVEITVGHPPAAVALPNIQPLLDDLEPPAQTYQQQLQGNPGDLVVLPFPDITLQTIGDARVTPNVQTAWMWGGHSSLNAEVYRKAFQPPLLSSEDVRLTYAASSNPSDPIGPGSINSTSQNWPLSDDPANKPGALLGAAIAKSDLWEAYERPASEQFPGYYFSMNWFSFIYGDPDSAYQNYVTPDGGQPIHAPSADDPGYFFMPGHGNPYVDNVPQTFGVFDGTTEFRHTAPKIPVTDIDDAGHVNPYTVMRVQATETAGNTTASTDAVLSTAKDFHCRECHAKGRIAALPQVPEGQQAQTGQFDWNQISQAFHSSPMHTCNGNFDPPKYPLCSDNYAPPEFFDSFDRNGQPSDNPFDQEYAALKNASSLHDFYDSVHLMSAFEYGFFGWTLADGQGNPLAVFDFPDNCSFCHYEMPVALEYGKQFGESPVLITPHGVQNRWISQSVTMHRFHGLLQLDPNNPNKILRGEDGRPALWDVSQTGSNPNSLFPAVDSDGNSIAMEKNCLRCHSGHREQMYRDRMFTAGVTCFDCHGDMLAVGQAYAKPKPGREGRETRVEWVEEPDCGSCHTGDANDDGLIKGNPRYFSGGVMKRAFDLEDPSATPRVPKSQRFAIQALAPKSVKWWSAISPTQQLNNLMTVSTPLFRNSRDTHGNVGCGACHGGAHEVWPNRDPNANDNLTSLQLQGHVGPILECNVCHTADSFKHEKDLDGGHFMTDLDADSGVLGGPHNTHPINDPYWFSNTRIDDANAPNQTDGTHLGGWHGVFAREDLKPGKGGENQCLACHGNDRKGTRLSRTPVDRVFDFSGPQFDQRKLKKAGFKSTRISVPAGTFIGCNTCHSIKTSCIGSPAGKNCGKSSDQVPGHVNHDPVIDSVPSVTAGIMGENYSYQVEAHDPDGDTLTFTLGNRPRPDVVAIDDQYKVTSTWPTTVFKDFQSGPFTTSYTVTVSDSRGGYATQTVPMTLDCPEGSIWKYEGQGDCVAASMGITITSTPPTGALLQGDKYTYTVVAADVTPNQTLHYALQGAPDGMTIGETGLIEWQTTDKTGTGGYPLQVIVTDDAGGAASQLLVLGVCASGQMWMPEMGMCHYHN